MFWLSALSRPSLPSAMVPGFTKLRHRGDTRAKLHVADGVVNRDGGRVAEYCHFFIAQPDRMGERRPVLQAADALEEFDRGAAISLLADHHLRLAGEKMGRSCTVRGRRRRARSTEAFNTFGRTARQPTTGRSSVTLQ